MTVQGCSRRARVGLAALGVLLAAGCTGSSTGAAGTGSAPGSTARPGRGPAKALSATLRTGGAPVEVADGSGPAALSVSVSRALFDAAPVVVLAAVDDPTGLREAAAHAERLGVPLLVQDTAAGGPGPVGSAPAATASAPPAMLDPALAAEITRLHPRDVLAVGRAAMLQGSPVRLTTDARTLPAVSRPAAAQPGGLSVLVRSGGDPATEAGTTAAAAMARGAGAAVVPVRGDDVRTDPAAVSALATGPARVLAAGSGFGPPDRLRSRVALAATGRQLPGGGQALFPGHRMVALYGAPGTPSLGVLGEQGVDAAIARAKQVAAPYAALSDVPVVPTFEIIATIASATPGPDNNYSSETDVAALRPWVEKAGAAGVYVVLDLQPGRADFRSQAKLYEPLLTLPYVGLALDAEWRLRPDQRPLQQIGSVGIDEVNGVVAWLADLTAARQLPQKLMVLHQFQLGMLRDERRLETGRDEVSLLIHMDGQGATGLKDGTWGGVTRAAPPGVTFGWKNFYDEDSPMLTPAQTMTRRPTPVMISYQ